MKSKHLLYLATIVGLLASVGTLPILAEEEEIPMWVHRARLAYTGRSPHGPDAEVAFIHIRDATLDMVEGATVSARWLLPDGTRLEEQVLTNEQGIAEFRLWEERGNYQLCVTSVTKTGWLYDPSLDRETCPVFTVPLPDPRRARMLALEAYCTSGFPDSIYLGGSIPSIIGPWCPALHASQDTGAGKATFCYTCPFRYQRA